MARLKRVKNCGEADMREMNVVEKSRRVVEDGEIVVLHQEAHIIFSSLFIHVFLPNAEYIHGPALIKGPCEGLLVVS